jgi:DNA gyrase/topoisomerase IV subunit B
MCGFCYAWVFGSLASLHFAVNKLQIKWTPKTPTFCHGDKTKSQLLGSRLKQWNLLENGVIVQYYRKRQSDIATYYSEDDDLVYCNNIRELMEELQLEHVF